jgi:uncharacterized LabA/DUF88 family protein
MFKPQSDNVKKWAQKMPQRIEDLEKLLQGDAAIYIDYANVRPWSAKLKWNIDLRRLKVFLRSFDNIKFVKFYDGTLEGDKTSERSKKIKETIFKKGFVTKPVKIMKQSIDYSSIKPTSSDLLEQFIRKCLLREYKLETIEYLNERFLEMNKSGKFYIEDRKCNFDVEIGTDMMLDLERNNIDTFALWSGDSDFCDPVEKLLKHNKNVILFATARKVSRELNDLQSKGLKIFEIKKIREFICWKKQL